MQAILGEKNQSKQTKVFVLFRDFAHPPSLIPTRPCARWEYLFLDIFCLAESLSQYSSPPAADPTESAIFPYCRIAWCYLDDDGKKQQVALPDAEYKVALGMYNPWALGASVVRFSATRRQRTRQAAKNIPPTSELFLLGDIGRLISRRGARMQGQLANTDAGAALTTGKGTGLPAAKGNGLAALLTHPALPGTFSDDTRRHVAPTNNRRLNHESTDLESSTELRIGLIFGHPLGKGTKQGYLVLLPGAGTQPGARRVKNTRDFERWLLRRSRRH
ncbi:hypothetical protein C8R47DRAFT_1071042 [Mycena vitilis]|nr:hypothetical protein C8R47DRAFT_1071042 [Mycena vitilis]